MIRFEIKIVYLQRYMTSFTDICMEKTLILQNPHWEGKTYAGLYRRQLMDNLLQKKTLPHVQILTGVRRCGKSTLFKLLINDLIEDSVSPKSILNINIINSSYSTGTNSGFYPPFGAYCSIVCSDTSISSNRFAPNTCRNPRFSLSSPTET